MKDFVDFIKDTTEGASIFNIKNLRESGPLPTGGDPNAGDMHIDDIRQNLSMTTMAPQPMDRTIEGWMFRLKTAWGKVSFKYHDPELKITKPIMADRFIDLYSDRARIRSYGKWEVEYLKINKVTFWRNFTGFNGKQYREELIVEVKLKPELAKAISWWRVLNPFAK